MANFTLRSMQPHEWNEVAELIYDSTNAWYVQNGRSAIFSGPKSNALLFCEVYEQLDPGCCVIGVDQESNRIAGSCFYHPRETHVSLGIMNVHPDYFGLGLARRLLSFITNVADERSQPVRLVSSAINLDSFSLYNRQGFVPRMIFQDLILEVPADGLGVEVEGAQRVRSATLDDVPKLADLELELAGIRREKDYQHFLENPDGIWHVSVIENATGNLDGFLASVTHPGSNMLGPGVTRTEEDAIALIHAELNRKAGQQPVWLVPAECTKVVQTMYEWGAKNCELHFAQVRGDYTKPTGVVMPTFMPETS